MGSEPLAKEGYAFMAAAFDVCNELSCGFTEDIYHESLEDELTARRIAFQAPPEILVFHKGRPLRKRFRPDFVVHAEIVVELKAVKLLADEHEAQILSHLKAMRKPVG